MTESVTDAAPGQDAPHPGRRRVLSILCLTEITSWGILYYAFPVLSPAISADTGWSTSTIVAAFSLSQLLAALVGIPVGRILDRHGPRWVMTAGSAVAVPALILVATAPNLVVFYLGWIVAGAAMGGVLYPPAFAALTRWWGTDRVRALMILTLAAGLASTVFAPLTALLASRSEWRRTYLVLAVLLAVITIPGHLLGLRGRWPDITTPGDDTARIGRDGIVRSRPFILLTASLSLAANCSQKSRVSCSERYPYRASNNSRPTEYHRSAKLWRSMCADPAKPVNPIPASRALAAWKVCDHPCGSRGRPSSLSHNAAGSRPAEVSTNSLRRADGSRESAETSDTLPPAFRNRRRRAPSTSVTSWLSASRSYLPEC